MDSFNFFCKKFFITSFQSPQFLRYFQELKIWNKKFNLIQKKDFENFWIRHAYDSAQIIHYIPSFNKLIDTTIFDFGSGNGLPSIILAILIQKEIFLFESNLKKCIFLHHIGSTLKLSIFIKSGRIENTLFIPNTNNLIITCRAFGSLSYVLSLINPLIGKKNICLFLFKSQLQVEQEINEAKKKWKFHFKLIPSFTQNESFILEVKI